MKKSKQMGYQFTEEEKKRFREEITAFFQEEMEQELGIIATERILDFFLEDMGKLVYNKALDDAKLWYQRLMDNGESDFYSLYRS